MTVKQVLAMKKKWDEQTHPETFCISLYLVFQRAEPPRDNFESRRKNLFGC